jgi:NDP-sugar pyrophosphorylase family protein
MAGAGSRVSDSFNLPKPLIQVKGKRLYQLALQGLPFEYVNHLQIVADRKIENLIDLVSETTSHIPQECTLGITYLDKVTSGQAETVFMSLDEIDSENGLLVFNCDTMISNDFPENYELFDGILGTFFSEDPGMSYADVDGEFVLRTVEKKVISSYASSGFYYFGSKQLFSEAYAGTIHNKESYVAPMYNYLIEHGSKIGWFNHASVTPLGTSAEILSFEKTDV